MSKKIKTVTFTVDTINPRVSEKCSCCGHRNIIPRIREMDLCMVCFKLNCTDCITSIGICVACKCELLEIDIPRSIPEYPMGEYSEL